MSVAGWGERVAAPAWAPARPWWRPDDAGGSEAAAPPARGGAAFAALLAFTAVLFLSPQSWFPWLALCRPALVAAAVAMAAHLAQRSAAPGPAPAARPLALAGCLAGWAVITAPFSLWPGGVVAFLFGSYLKTIAVFWLLAGVIDRAARFRVVTWLLVTLSVPLALCGLWNFADGVMIPGGAHPGAPRIAGYEAPLTANPNDLALTLNLLLPFTVARLAGARRGGVRLALGAVLLLQIGAVIATFSRAGFLTLAVLGALHLFKTTGRRRLGAAAVLLVALACAPLLPATYLARIRTISDIESDPTGSAQARWSDMVVAARRALDDPLVGAGAGMNALALNEERGPAWKKVHNVYLEYAVDLGLPGLLLFLLLFGSCLAAARAVERRGAGELARCAVAVQTSLLGFAVGGMFHPAGFDFYFYYVAGLAAALPRAAAREEE